MRLAYTSEAESPLDRAWRKQRKLEARLDENRTLKPKGMHWRTFNALCDRITAVEEEKDAAFVEGAARLFRLGFPEGIK
jgi:hypothetical protein